MKSLQLPPATLNHDWFVYAATEPMILAGVYDPDQIWLPFMEHVYFQVEASSEVDIPALHRASLGRLRQLAAEPHVPTDTSDEVMYAWKKNVEQRMLPFAIHRIISHRHFKRLGAAGYAGWDRAEDGELMEVSLDVSPGQGNRREEIKAWCAETTRGCFYIRSGAISVVFERADDAILFKLTYC